MTLLLKEGDYVPDASGKLKSLSGAEEALQEVLLRLTARRGAFPLLPELGSRLELLLRGAPGERETLARQYVLEALAPMTELTLEDVTLTEVQEQGLVTVTLRWQGEQAAVTVAVR